MPITRNSCSALLTLVLTAAFSAGAVAQTLTADEKELAAYKLTMPAVKKTMAVIQGLAEEAAKDPKFQEMQKLKAQIDALQEKEELTEAEQAQLEKLIERRDAMENAEDAGEVDPFKNSNTIADMAAAIKAHPGAMRIMAREGLTPRDYAKTMLTLLQATLIEGFSQGKVDLKKLPPGVNPDNILFVREHKAELEAMQRALEPKKK